MAKGLVPEQHGAMSLIKTIQGLAVSVPIEVLDELLHILIRTDTTVPILDPTFYRDKMQEIHMTKECLQAFASYRHTLAKLKEEAVSRGVLPSTHEPQPRKLTERRK